MYANCILINLQLIQNIDLFKNRKIMLEDELYLFSCVNFIKKKSSMCHRFYYQYLI